MIIAKREETCFTDKSSPLRKTSETRMPFIYNINSLKEYHTSYFAKTKERQSYSRVLGYIAKDAAPDSQPWRRSSACFRYRCARNISSRSEQCKRRHTYTTHGQRELEQTTRFLSLQRTLEAHAAFHPSRACFGSAPSRDTAGRRTLRRALEISDNRVASCTYVK